MPNFRQLDAAGQLRGDRVQLVEEPLAGQPLLQVVMRGGRRLGSSPTLAQSRAYCASQLRTLPAALRSLEPMSGHYTAGISPGLRALAHEVDADIDRAGR